MKKILRLYICLLLVLGISSCSVNKFIPEGKYLLDEVEITSDTKEVHPSLFNSYIRQNPNAKWFSLVKIPMRIYCLSGRDSTRSFNRFLRKLGDEPVIYNPVVSQKSRQEIEKAVRNMGYMRARVYLDTVRHKNKLKLNYRIVAGKPYMVRHIAYHVDDLEISSLIEQDSAQSLLHEGMNFDVVVLDNERQRITRHLQNHGYYKFNKDFLVYQADTVRNTYQVDLTMKLLPFQQRKEDIPTKHRQYYLRRVNYLAVDNAATWRTESQDYDTLYYKGLDISFKDKPYLRPNTLYNFNYLRAGELYHAKDVQDTYASMGRLHALKYTNIQMNEVASPDSSGWLDATVLLTKGKNQTLSFEVEGTNSAGDLYHAKDVQDTCASMGRLHALKYTNIQMNEVASPDSSGWLDATVLLTKGKNQTLSFEVEGTNSAGDLGAAASLTFQHRNVFRGSETFSFKVRGAYEAITGLQEGYENDDYREYGVETSLNFPEFKFPFLSSAFKRRIRATSEVGIDYTSQLRPEFTRTLASASWSYRWVDKRTSQHRFDLLKVNYVYVPWKSDNFREYLENLSDRNSILTKSYEDQFIVSMGYSFLYNSANDRNRLSPLRHPYSIRVNVEEAGNLLYAASKALHRNPRDEKGYVMANIPFAQYIKGDFDFAQNINFDERNSLVFHIGMGIAYPYGNSQILPFEKRYFSGGPNSVRGWSVRSLGPGSYQGSADGMNYINHSGDIKLDLNVEYRTHLFWKLNGAVFVDAGNIWNIRNYEGQEEGTFRFNRFYKQLAVAYGLGIRFDLDYLIIRFDGGMKAVNPMYSGKDKYPFLKPNFDRDFAFHFAVGYPF